VEFVVERNDKFFVWTKKGRAPSFAHDTHASALAEAKRLAATSPGRKFIVQQFLEKVSVEGVAVKEPAMNKTVWYGAHDNDVRFATSKASLTEAGINNPQSFTVNGDIQGLNLVDEEQTQQPTTGSQQPA
jgi:hypothetical protein